LTIDWKDFCVMAYTLGVDVGGTFTDIFLVNELDGQIFTAKVPSTPQDSSIGVLNGIERVCNTSGISPRDIGHVMHGTTVATNTILTGSGALVGLVTTKGFRQILQIARSYVPGGLGGWVIYNKSEPMAPLELTVEADERIGADGKVVRPLDEQALVEQLKFLKERGIEALTVCLINSFANDVHEQRISDLAATVMPEIPVSLSYDVIPEMQEYERAVTTVANSYVRPRVQTYIENLSRELNERMDDVKLHVLRSDGGLASSSSAAQYPVNMLMSGPAGGVAGALWIAGRLSEYFNLGHGRDVDGRRIGAKRPSTNSARNDHWRCDCTGVFNRCAHSGCGRRIDCPCAGANRRAARWTTKFGCRTGSGGLRQRRTRTDGDRREYGVGLPSRKRIVGRRYGARRRCSKSGC
jgi:hypothetical protein